MAVTICTTCFNGKNFWILRTVTTYFSNVSALAMETCFDYRMGTKFLGAFEKPRKAAISFVMSVRPSARNNSAPARQIFMKIVTWVFSNIFREDSISIKNLTRIMGTLR
jgi:branched-subunit amino acid permease